MAFYLHISNDLNNLAKRLCQDLNQHGAELGVMRSQQVITQTEGMSSWLKNLIAAQSGIAANIQFVQPADVISRLEWMVTDQRSRQTFTREELCWVIFMLLGEEDFREKFPAIAEYYFQDELRQSALARKVADLFDQYQIYRSEVIAEWNGYTADHLSETDNWQAWLWRTLRNRFGDATRDRTQIADLIITRLQESEVQERIRQRIPHLYIFGIAVITPFFQRIFKELSAFMDIHFFILNPAPQTYWLDHYSEKQLARFINRTNFNPAFELAPPLGNDLLLNWGKIVRDAFWLLFQDENLINDCDDHLSIPLAAPGNLLEKIHYSIYHNIPYPELQEGNEVYISNNDHKDGSITINGCYTPSREVEVLYNYLVTVVDQPGSAYSSREILVMVPDIDLYAPYIHAVFGQADHRFKYSIADESVAAENNLFSALEALLDFDGTAFKVESVLELLDYPYIRNRFQLENVDALRTAVRQASIFHSMEGRQEDGTCQISWSMGLKKMIYGLCMSGPEGAEFFDGKDVLMPLNTAEGTAALDRIRLAYFIRVLLDKVNARSTSRTISEWAGYLKGLLEDMVFQAGEKDDDDYPRFIKLIEELTEMNAAAQATVSFEVFRHSFLDKLLVERRTQHFAGKGITFCSLVPMRSIPFRIVAMLGMDFDAFPRRENQVNFSLLAENRRGDRNVKDNDKHLFLETLLSAREKLYISYQAKSEKDGADLPPSVLVDELIDFVARAQKKDAEKLRKEWVKVHPLHGFSKAYGQNGMVSYLPPDRFRTDLPVQPANQRMKIDPPDEMDIKELAKFLENPPKTFLTKYFNIWYFDEETLLPDHELFELNHFQNRQLRKALVQLDDQEQEKFVRQQSASGALPLHNLGIATAELVQKEIAVLKSTLQLEAAGWEAVKLKIDVHLEGIRLIGQPDFVYRAGEAYRFIHWTVNTSSSAKNILNGFIHFLGLVASGHPVEFIFIDADVNITKCPAGQISPGTAKELLSEFVGYYKEGLNNYFPFYPALIKAIAAGKNYQEVLKIINSGKEGNHYSPFQDDYFVRAVEDGFMAEAQFERMAKATNRIAGMVSPHLPNILK